MIDCQMTATDNECFSIHCGLQRIHGEGATKLGRKGWRDAAKLAERKEGCKTWHRAGKAARYVVMTQNFHRVTRVERNGHGSVRCRWGSTVRNPM